MRCIRHRKPRPSCAWPLLLSVALGAVSCAGAGDPSAAPAGDSSARVAIAPLNLGRDTGLELEDAEQVVADELARFFQERGARVGVVHRGDAERAWRAVHGAIEETDRDAEDDGLDRVAAAFTIALRQHSDFAFDYVLIPSLVLRDARVFGRIASWDGVRRRVRPRRASGATQAHYFREWEGEITGLSLHVLVYEPDGRRVYEGWGGLDLTHDPVVIGNSMSPRPMPQAEVLANAGYVREGVELALRPYLRDARR